MKILITGGTGFIGRRLVAHLKVQHEVVVLTRQGSRAYDLLDAAAVQPLTYLQVVLAAIIGVSVFGETLNLNTVVGSAIVVGAGIFTIWRESVVARRRAAEKSMARDTGK